MNPSIVFGVFSVLTLALLNPTQAHAKFLRLYSTDGIEVSIEYTVQQTTSNSNKPTQTWYADMSGVWVNHRSGLPEITRIDAVFVEHVNTEGQCGTPSSSRENVHTMPLPRGQYGFYSPGTFQSREQGAQKAQMLLSSNGYCFRTGSVNEVAVVLTDRNGNQYWLTDPVTGLHNFRLMF